MSQHRFSLAFDDAKVDRVFADIDQCRLPGATVGIAIDGRPVYRKGFGLANMELPTVLTPSIRMYAYSITKHFTSLAFMLLCEDGKADPDAPIGTYLPQLNPAIHQVTGRHLMTNSSGIRDVRDILRQFGGIEKELNISEMVGLYGVVDDVDDPPGHTFNYNNGGYVLLGVIIERLSGLSLAEVFRTRIFDPVGMYDSMFRPRLTNFEPNSATMHMSNPVLEYDRAYAASERGGDAGVVSTADDLLRWMAHMKAPVVGRPETWAAMRTPGTLNNGASSGYAFGLVSAPYRGVDTLFHSGGGMGANSQMIMLPGLGLDIVVLVNRHDVMADILANRVIDACVTGLDAAAEDAAGPVSEGVFVSPITGDVVQMASPSRTSAYPWTRGARQVASINGMDVPVEPDGEGALRPSRVFTFERRKAITPVGPIEAPQTLIFDNFGNVEHLEKMAPPGGEADDVALAGRYRSEAFEVDIAITQATDGLRLTSASPRGSAEFRLERLGKLVWRARSTNPSVGWGGIVALKEGGAVFTFSTMHTRQLPFRRVAA